MSPCPASTPSGRGARRSFLRDEAGSIGTIFGVLLFVFLFAAASAVEFGQMTRNRTKLQNALDAAVLAGAAASLSQAETVAAQTLLSGLGSENWDEITTQWGRRADGAFTGSSSVTRPMVFGALFGGNSVVVGARAAARAESVAGQVCFLVLDPAASQSLLSNTKVTITAPNCQIDVASRGANAAVFNAGNAYDVSKICIGSLSVLINGGSPGPVKAGCATAANPFVGKLTKPADAVCTMTSQTFAGSVTLSPGVYCGTFDFNPSGTLTLQPGLYVFRGARWNINPG